jgi:ATP-dependent Clp protease adapter protein ClpS/GNAT superfamily N-acetyltransferase
MDWDAITGPFIFEVTQEPAWWPSLCALFAEFDMETHGAHGAAPVELPGPYSRPNGFLLLMVDGDFPVGCVAARAEGGDAFMLERLYVRPTSRNGVLGTRLLLQALDLAIEIGALRVQIRPNNSSMAGSLARANFRPVAADLRLYEWNVHDWIQAVLAKHDAELGRGQWAVTLHNDDTTPMDLVIELIMRQLGYSRELACALMFSVHLKGQAVIARLERERPAGKLQRKIAGDASHENVPLRATEDRLDA